MELLPEGQESKTELFHEDDYIRIERWYQDIKDYTFETIVLPFSLEEALELKRCRENYVHINRMEEWLEKDPTSAPANAAEIIADLSKALTTPGILAVTKRLDDAIKSCGETGAFVKLSTRSPKDACFTTDEMKDIIAKDLKQLSDKVDVDMASWIAAAVASFVRASSQSLRVFDGKQAMRLFWRSRRTYEDISMLELFQGGKKFHIDLVVRKWENIDPTWEFRAFVVKNKMTTITQYYSLSYIPAIAANKDVIAKSIKKYWKRELKPKITALDTYTIDFAVDPHNLNSIRVIELNHPPPTAGTALFDWTKEEDRRIVSCGPFEIRVLDKLADNPLAVLDEKLRVWMAELAPSAFRDKIRQMAKETEVDTAPDIARIKKETPKSGTEEKSSCTMC